MVSHNLPSPSVCHLTDIPQANAVFERQCCNNAGHDASNHGYHHTNSHISQTTVRQLRLAPRPNKICNDPPDILEHGQHGHARDSNNVRAPNTRRGHGCSQEVVVIFDNRCAFQPAVLARPPLPPWQGSRLNSNLRQSLRPAFADNTDTEILFEYNLQ